VSPKQLRGSRFRRIFRGVYVDAGIPDHPLIRAQAALALHPANAYASHVSAARIYRVPVPKISDEHVTVSEVGDRSRVAGIHCTWPNARRPKSGRWTAYASRRRA
jgi:hypothetical protein